MPRGGYQHALGRMRGGRGGGHGGGSMREAPKTPPKAARVGKGRGTTPLLRRARLLLASNTWSCGSATRSCGVYPVRRRYCNGVYPQEPKENFEGHVAVTGVAYGIYVVVCHASVTWSAWSNIW